MKTIISALGAAVLASCGLFGQAAAPTGSAAQAAAVPPAFDVASVKPNHGDARRSFYPGLQGGAFTAENVTLKTLVAVAYDVPETRITGPGWIGSDRFDLAAKPPEGAPRSQLAPMLQLLLKERFLVAVHRETKEMPSYEMVAAKGGVRLHASEVARPPAEPPAAPPPAKPPYAGGAQLGGNGTMAQIADELASVAGRPVVDRTGMEGRFFFMLNYAELSDRPDEGAAGFGPPDFFTAVQQQLGLKLEAKVQPIEILIVDHAERVPTPN